MDVDKKIEAVDKDIQYFDKTINAATKLTAPYIVIIKLLVAALIATNLFWAGVHFYTQKRAYDDPTEIDITQTQDFDGQTQEQQGKGVN